MISTIPTNRKLGFTLAEVMFAVVILGIGFIMVAGIFPVALQQVKASSDAAVAQSVAQEAINYIEAGATDGANPTGASDTTFKAYNPAAGTPPDANYLNSTSNCRFWPATLQPNASAPYQQPGYTDFIIAPKTYTSLWHATGNNLIYQSDPEYACMFLYKRLIVQTILNTSALQMSPSIQVLVFPVVARNSQIFDSRYDTTIPAGAAAGIVPNLYPKEVYVAIANDVVEAGGLDLVAFDKGPGGIYLSNIDSAVVNAYLVIANDNISGAQLGRLNGRVMKLGARRTDLDNNISIFPGVNQSVVYELQPGADFSPDAGSDGVLGTSDDINCVGMNCTSPSTVTAGRADAFVIGRGYADPTAASPTYLGPSMSIGNYYSAVVRVSP